MATFASFSLKEILSRVNDFCAVKARLALLTMRMRGCLPRASEHSIANMYLGGTSARSQECECA